MKTIEQIRALLKLDLQLKGEPEDWQGWYSRAAIYNKESMNIEERSIDNIVATEQAVLVFDWYRWEPVWEILLIDGMEFPANKQIPFLDQHSRFAINNLLGSVRNLKKVTDEKLGKIIMGRVFVSDEYAKMTPDPWKLIEQGHLTDTSVGYKTFDNATVFLKKGEKTKIKGVEYVHNLEGDYGMAIRERSQVKEDSAVLVGADDLAKLQRSFNSHLEQKVVAESSVLGKKKIFVMETYKPIIQRSNTMKVKSASGEIIDIEIDVKDTPEFRSELNSELEKKKTDDAAKEKLNNERIAELLATAEEYRNLIPDSKPGEKAQELIKSGGTALDFFRWAQPEMKKPQPSRKASSIAGELSSKEIDRYELRFAVLMSAGKDLAEKEIKKKFGEDGMRSIGLLRDVSDELCKRTGMSTGGFLIDTSLLDKRSENFREKLGKRADQNVSGSAGAVGGYTVNEQIIAQSFIEYLSNQSVFIQSGVQMLPGMVGDIPFIRELTENTAYWVAESNAPTTGGITYSRENATPKTVGALTSISRQLLLQSAWVSEAYLRRKLIGTIQRDLDKKIAYGLGASNQIMGIKNETGVNGIDGSNFVRSKALTMIGSLQSGNAELGPQGWITHPNTKAILMDKMLGTSGMRYLWEDNDVMVARSGKGSNQVTAGDLFLGGFSTILLLEWGVVEVDANPYGTNWAAGDLLVKALMSVDTYFEYPQALSVAENVS